jgi:2,3-bisphosphoglycerate-independent phosphoglycerate mutase
MPKYIICLGDGMTGLPEKSLNDKTPLALAQTPNLDFIVKNGIGGTVQTIPKGFSPGSDVANMGLLGYDPEKYYTGRGPIEAASLGISVPKDMLAFRCNFVNISNDIMKDFSAGHIDNRDAQLLIEELNAHFDNKLVHFFAGVSYRNIVLLNSKYIDVKCTPPHDVSDKNIKEYMPKGKYAEELIAFMQECQQILVNSEINRKRLENNKCVANNIWPWSQGKMPDFPAFKDLYKLDGGVITAVDLLKGIGKLAKLETPFIEGATGYLDTNYQGKIEAALKILENQDFVYIHIEAPDEAGHKGDVALKIKAIEDFDKKIVAPMLAFQKAHKSCRIMVLPDHATPCVLKTHTTDLVPFGIYYPDINKDDNETYGEHLNNSTQYCFKKASELLKFFLSI